MPKVPYPYEVNGKLVTGNGSLIPICSLLPSLTVQRILVGCFNFVYFLDKLSQDRSLCTVHAWNKIKPNK